MPMRQPLAGALLALLAGSACAGWPAVRADCNRGRGSWKETPQRQLELGPVALTRAMCPPSALLRRFARDLGYVRPYVRKDGKLYLALMADGGIYAFEPLPQP